MLELDFFGADNRLKIMFSYSPFLFLYFQNLYNRQVPYFESQTSLLFYTDISENLPNIFIDEYSKTKRWNREAHNKWQHWTGQEIQYQPYWTCIQEGMEYHCYSSNKRCIHML